MSSAQTTSIRDIEHIGMRCEINYEKALSHRVKELLKFSNDSFPGAQPVIFDSSHLELLLQEDYFVCEKTDGIRYLLYCINTKEGPTSFLINRSNNYRYINSLILPCRDNINKFQHETLIDGELVVDTNKETNQKVIRYLAFDLMVLNATVVTQRSFSTRLGMLQQEVIQPLDTLLRGNTEIANKLPFQIELKKMERSYGLNLVLSNLPHLMHPSDGLIFTPVNLPYKAGVCSKLLKWKPSDKITADFRIKASLNHERKPVYTLQVFHNNNFKDFSPLQLSRDMYSKWRQNPPHGKIGEFRWSPNWIVTTIEKGYAPITEKGGWIFVKFRQDRNVPNDEQTALRILKSAKDGVTKEILEKSIEEIRNRWKEREKQNARQPSFYRSMDNHDIREMKLNEEEKDQINIKDKGHEDDKSRCSHIKNPYSSEEILKKSPSPVKEKPFFEQNTKENNIKDEENTLMGPEMNHPNMLENNKSPVSQPIKETKNKEYTETTERDGHNNNASILTTDIKDTIHEQIRVEIDKDNIEILKNKELMNNSFPIITKNEHHISEDNKTNNEDVIMEKNEISNNVASPEESIEPDFEGKDKHKDDSNDIKKIDKVAQNCSIILANSNLVNSAERKDDTNSNLNQEGTELIKDKENIKDLSEDPKVDSSLNLEKITVSSQKDLVKRSASFPDIDDTSPSKQKRRLLSESSLIKIDCSTEFKGCDSTLLLRDSSFTAKPSDQKGITQVQGTETNLGTKNNEEKIDFDVPNLVKSENRATKPIDQMVANSQSEAINDIKEDSPTVEEKRKITNSNTIGSQFKNGVYDTIVSDIDPCQSISKELNKSEGSIAEFDQKLPVQSETPKKSSNIFMLISNNDSISRSKDKNKTAEQHKSQIDISNQNHPNSLNEVVEKNDALPSHQNETQYPFVHKPMSIRELSEPVTAEPKPMINANKPASNISFPKIHVFNANSINSTNQMISASKEKLDSLKSRNLNEAPNQSKDTPIAAQKLERYKPEFNVPDPRMAPSHQNLSSRKGSTHNFQPGNMYNFPLIPPSKLEPFGNSFSKPQTLQSLHENHIQVSTIQHQKAVEQMRAYMQTQGKNQGVPSPTIKDSQSNLTSGHIGLSQVNPQAQLQIRNTIPTQPAHHSSITQDQAIRPSYTEASLQAYQHSKLQEQFIQQQREMQELKNQLNYYRANTPGNRPVDHQPMPPNVHVGHTDMVKRDNEYRKLSGEHYDSNLRRYSHYIPNPENPQRRVSVVMGPYPGQFPPVGEVNVHHQMYHIDPNAIIHMQQRRASTSQTAYATPSSRYTQQFESHRPPNQHVHASHHPIPVNVRPQPTPYELLNLVPSPNPNYSEPTFQGANQSKFKSPLLQGYTQENRPNFIDQRQYHHHQTSINEHQSQQNQESSQSQTIPEEPKPAPRQSKGMLDFIMNP